MWFCYLETEFSVTYSPFVILKVGPLAAYYQVPLRHILLVCIFVSWCRLYKIINAFLQNNHQVLCHITFIRDMKFFVGLWWDELTKWCSEDSAKRRTWISQWVCFEYYYWIEFMWTFINHFPMFLKKYVLILIFFIWLISDLDLSILNLTIYQMRWLL